MATSSEGHTRGVYGDHGVSLWAGNSGTLSTEDFDEKLRSVDEGAMLRLLWSVMTAQLGWMRGRIGVALWSLKEDWVGRLAPTHLRSSLW